MAGEHRLASSLSLSLFAHSFGHMLDETKIRLVQKVSNALVIGTSKKATKLDMITEHYMAVVIFDMLPSGLHWQTPYIFIVK
jgi:hypothetical protein